MSQFKRVPAGIAAPTNEWEKDADQAITEIQDQLQELLNKGLLFDDNFSCFKTTFTTSATPGNATTIAHGLKRTPIGYSVIRKDKAAHIFESAAPDGTNVYIKSDVASVTVTLLIF